MIADVLATYDFNLPLSDAISDPCADGHRRRLAELSLGRGLDGGYYESQELADLALGAARDRNAGMDMLQSEAAQDLIELIERPGCDYQRSLHDAIKDLPFADGAAHLSWLADLMGKRADMYRAVKATGAAMPPLPNG